MLNLANGDALEMVLTGTADIDWAIDYIDVDTTSQEPENPAFVGDTDNTAATHTLVSGASGKIRNLKRGNWHNRHASTGNTLTIQRNPGTGTTTQLFHVTLAAGEVLVLDDRGMFSVYDVNGAIKVGASAATDTVAGLIAIATQAEQEAGSVTNKAVTPGRQHFHPSTAKFWLKAGTTGNNLASYNVASLTDTGTGVLTITIGTDFSSSDYCVQVAISNLDATIDATTDKQTCMIANASQAAGSVQVLCSNETATSASDPQFWFVNGFGDHA